MAAHLLEDRPGQEKPPETSSEQKAVWQRYPSIESVGNSKFLRTLLEAGQNIEWVASEKVHGSNFCFETDGEIVEYASRTAKLGPGANFFNASTTMPQYHPYVLKAFRLARCKWPELQRLLIYGEYFGGWYPGQPGEPDRKSGLKKVQGGIAYSPDHHFYAFDVALDGETFLDFEDCQQLLTTAGFPLVARPLKRGTLAELVAIDVESLETTVPDMLGLPRLAEHRIAEGVIIRPAKESSGGASRPMLKLKSRAFWESTNQTDMGMKQVKALQDALSSVGICPGDCNRPTQPISSFGGLVEEAQNLVTKNRLRAVISKSPDLLQESMVQRLAGLFTKDILDDLEKLCKERLDGLLKERGAFNKVVMRTARAFVMSEMPRIRADVG